VNLPIGDNQLTQSSKTSSRLLSVPIGRFPRYRDTGCRRLRPSLSTKLSGIPNEFLKNLIMILHQDETLRLLNDGSKVLENDLPLVRQVLVRGSQFRVIREGGECDVDLFV